VKDGPSLAKVWAQGHAAPARNAAEAKAALALLPELGDVLPAPGAVFFSYEDGDVGALYGLAGDLPQAAARLEASTRLCTMYARIEEHNALGRVKEKQGDKSGACASYARLVERWGHAHPRSVSAEEARARLAKLDCPKAR
jgi:hypothetical protein